MKQAEIIERRKAIENEVNSILANDQISVEQEARANELMDELKDLNQKRSAAELREKFASHAVTAPFASATGIPSKGPECTSRPSASSTCAAASGDVDRGILLCCTGVGMAIAANKIPGVRAATCHDEVTAEMSRRHNDLNVLCLSAEMIGPELQDKLIRTWLSTPFEGGRHARRVAKITALESACGEKRVD